MNLVTANELWLHKVLQLYVFLCRDLRLIDVNEFHEREDSMELPTFQGLIMRHVESAKDKLLKK